MSDYKDSIASAEGSILLHGHWLSIHEVKILELKVLHNQNEQRIRLLSHLCLSYMFIHVLTSVLLTYLLLWK